MKIDDLMWWQFDKDLTEGCLIECPKCNESSIHSEWIETEVGCEDCGSHSAIKCPKCFEAFDHVWSPKFHVV